MSILTIESESDHFSPYRADGKLYGFVCVVTGANQPVSSAIAVGLAGIHQYPQKSNSGLALGQLHSPWRNLHLYLYLHLHLLILRPSPRTSAKRIPTPKSSTTLTLSPPNKAHSPSSTKPSIPGAVLTSGSARPASLTHPPSTPQRLPTCRNALSQLHDALLRTQIAPACYGEDNYPNAAPKDQRYSSIVVVSSTVSPYGGCWVRVTPCLATPP